MCYLEQPAREIPTPNRSADSVWNWPAKTFGNCGMAGAGRAESAHST